MKRRGTADPVTLETRQLVLVRDGMCFLFRMDRGHACRDAYGNPHSPFDLLKMTLDHVKDHPRMGLRAPSDMRHLVAMCHAGNVGVPSKAVRLAERAYLAEFSL